LKLLRAIEDAASKIAPGRAPNFIEAHVVKALVTIGSQGPVGRLKLANTLGLGEGSIRTLIRHFEKEGLIRISREGIVLTGDGERVFSSLRSNVSQTAEIPKGSLTVGEFNVAILVRGAAGAVRAGVEQRDAAMKAGAKGATTLVFKGGRMTMPDVSEDVFRDLPKIRKKLMSELKPQENDVIVIGSAGDRWAAELGATAAALETLKARSCKA